MASRKNSLYVSINSGEVNIQGASENMADRQLNFTSSRWKWILVITGYLPPMKCAQRCCCNFPIMGVVLGLLIALYNLSEFGILTMHSTWRSSVEMDAKIPFTSAHMFIWELRWLISYILGIIFCCKKQLKTFVDNVYFPSSEIKCYKWLWLFHTLIVIIFSAIVPAALHWYELLKWGHEGTAIPVVDALFFFFCRIISLPSFCMITFVLFLLGSNIKALGQRLIGLKRGQEDVNYAKTQILEVQTTINKAESNLQWYLIIHLILIISAATMGVASFLERLHMSQNQAQIVLTDQAMVDWKDIKNAQVKSILQKANSAQDRNNGIDASLQRSHSIGSLSTSDKTQRTTHIPLTGILAILTKAENTSNLIVFSEDAEPYDQFFYASRQNIFWLFLCNLAEVLVLYLIPICLIFRLEKCIQDVKERIETINWLKRDQDELLVVESVVKDKVRDDVILKCLSLLKPVRVYGYRLDFIRTVILVCFTQIIALLMKMVVNPSK